jgi:GABA(A) receptor-associated protein
MKSNFKQKNSFTDRYNESITILTKYPERIPVIVERATNSSNDCPDIDKNKYLVPKELTIGQFIFVIRQRMNLPAEKAIFLFVNGIIPSTSSAFSTIYNNHKDEDSFLYITYSFENTFG